MIKFSNGHKFEFCCASGALGFNGNGWWFEQPFKWLGVLRPSDFTIITKTLTYFPRAGNLKMLCPWRCVRLLRGGVVNAVGLTNPGYRHWINNTYKRIGKKKIIVSLAPYTFTEARDMATDFNSISRIVGIELNLSCPNEDNNVDYMCELANYFTKYTRHPVIAKVGYEHHMKVCKALDGKVEAFDLINSVPWDIVCPNEKSPLSKYHIGNGGVSGKMIADFAKEALVNVRNITNAAIISGGGINSSNEALGRFNLGADAVSFGTIFMYRPWLPNKIVRRLRNKIPVRRFMGIPVDQF